MSDENSAMVMYVLGSDEPRVDHTAPPAERLRAAAKRVRDAAGKATPGADPYPGGWSGFGDPDRHRSALYAGPGVDGYRTGTVVEVKEDCDECVPMSQEDADYIGMLHPAVGHALADLLDEMVQYGLSPLCDPAWPPFVKAVATADQILGIPAELALAEHLAGTVTA
ncbi:hypothetical protein Drose_06450 [Dactylosporangium roseum]|uniref:Uncharacterized protein n=1 Tax=Dactylosporangium roseum TaxID=47989 RepID=A0ABY5Z776_9ACTN|nr:hypothetical protein [Dactylosporangium roseum]UWZ37913.1 hypothetical protein Drose_06450 [Dactylosporangium roseum]